MLSAKGEAPLKGDHYGDIIQFEGRKTIAEMKHTAHTLRLSQH